MAKAHMPILAAACISALAGCATPHSATTLTPSDNGREISLSVGQVFIIELPSNRTTGYQWSERPASDGVLISDGKPDYITDSSAKSVVGAGGTEIWRYRAVCRGRQSLHLNYLRPWDKVSTSANTVAF